VRDDDVPVEQGRRRRERRGEVGAVLGGRPALPGPEQRVPAEGDDGQHPAAPNDRLCFTSTKKAMAV
jgi:hypothetical protein